MRLGMANVSVTIVVPSQEGRGSQGARVADAESTVVCVGVQGHQFISSIMHLSSRHLLSVYYVSYVFLGAEDATQTKQTQCLHRGAYFLVVSQGQM